MSGKAVISLVAEDTLVQNASPGETVPLWEWIGDEPATTFSC